MNASRRAVLWVAFSAVCAGANLGMLCMLTGVSVVLDRAALTWTAVALCLILISSSVNLWFNIRGAFNAIRDSVGSQPSDDVPATLQAERQP